MANEMWKRLEQQFYKYTETYDNNIMTIAKEKNLVIDESTLKQILDDAKHRTV
ncbi:MAG: hypothetical protein KAX49_10320 [Halanaerobiales bacterium]|nr:hypothetical protein [Halanaerobiales bacterium]